MGIEEHNSTQTMESKSGSGTKAGSPSGDSRLSGYFVVIVTVIVTVLVLTVSTQNFLGSSFGGWDSKAAARVDMRVDAKRLRTTVNKIDPPPPKDAKHASFSEDNFPDSEDQGKTKTKVKKVKDKKKEENEVEMEVETVGQKQTGKKKKKSRKKKIKNTEEVKNNDVSEGANEAAGSFTPMLNSLLNARQAMVQKLRDDYGEKYFDTIFRTKDGDPDEKLPMGNEIVPEKLKMEYLPIRPFGPKDIHYTAHFSAEDKQKYQSNTDPKDFHSKWNLQRKMMIKILMAKKDSSVNKYVWATGGHSASAGHGNLFHETYTKVMEATAGKIFEAAGLEFEARNYGMGATSSAAEMSMCFREVYGDDVDIFSWDFGMLEARDYLNVRLLHYASRGFLSNQQGIVPAFVALQEISSARRAMVEELHHAYRGEGDSAENNGLALFLRDEKLWKEMKAAIPETSGKTTEEINELPEFVRYFKCNGALEKGEPYCDEKKYNHDVCPKRMGQASWHPGWKYHALFGNSMALFLTEILEDALRLIDEEVTERSPEDLLSELLAQEDHFQTQMMDASPEQMPKSFKTTYWYNNTLDEKKYYPEAEAIGLETGSDKLKAIWKALDSRALFLGPSICHTARVPSHTRFNGILTNQPELTGKQVLFGNETYFTGIEDKKYHELQKISKEKGEVQEAHNMHLVWREYHERETTCGDVLAMPDYHDFFMAEEGEGWTILEFPNKAEQDAYGFHENKDKYKGMLMLVPRFCGFGVCEEGFLGHQEFIQGKWSIKVNGNKVTTLTRIGQDAILLEHKNGIIFDPNEEGIYRLEFKVREPKNFIKISAFILF